MEYEDKAVSFELLMRFYNSKKPIHCSTLAEESLLGDYDLLVYASNLKEKGFVENPRIFGVESHHALFFKISPRGKKFVEKIIEKFPLDKLDNL